MAERLIRESDVIKLIDEWLDNYPLPRHVEKGLMSHEELLAYIAEAPTIEAYTGAEYMHLLKLAKKMHTWIFLHTVNEDEVYKELGLTDEDNVLLGSLGKVELVSKADKFNHIADIGKKEPICGHPQEGVKIPVISMEDVPKLAKEMEK